MAGSTCIWAWAARPESVLTAVAMRCMEGDIQVKLSPQNAAELESIKADGYDPERVYFAKDLARGEDMMFACTGITDGELLPGVKFRGNKAVSYSLATRLKTKTIRHIQAEHNLRQKTIPSKTLSKNSLYKYINNRGGAIFAPPLISSGAVFNKVRHCSNRHCSSPQARTTPGISSPCRRRSVLFFKAQNSLPMCTLAHQPPQPQLLLAAVAALPTSTRCSYSSRHGVHLAAGTFSRRTQHPQVCICQISMAMRENMKMCL